MSSRKLEGSFIEIAKKISPFLKEEGIPLILKGFPQIKKSYFSITDNHPSEIYEFMIDCQLWINYLSEVENLIDLKKEEQKLRLDMLKTEAKIQGPHLEKMKQIKKEKELSKLYELFYKHLVAERKFLENAYSHSKEMYQRAYHQLHFGAY